jgi:single-strand DNA-binding protein
MSINRVTITGNLTRDVELKAAKSGMEIAAFTVAVNDRVKVDGDWTDYANFIDCKIFGKRAGALAPYLAKGTKVAVDGKLRWSQWEKDGQKRNRIEVIVDEIELFKGREAKRSDDSLFDDDCPF